MDTNQPVVGTSRGKTPGSGRKAGTPNKITRVLTEAIDEALERVGGVDYLVDVANKDRKAFCALLGRRLPKDMTVHADGSVTIHVLTGVPHGTSND